MNEFTLTHYDAMRQAIVQAYSIDEVKEIRDKAEAMRHYAKQAGESLENQNMIAAIKVRAQRRMGEIAQEFAAAPGARTDLTLIHDGSRLPTKQEVLTKAGISRTENVRNEAIASLPEEVFEEHIVQTIAKRQELTSAGLQKLAKEQRRQANRRSYQENGNTPFVPISHPTIHIHNLDARLLAEHTSDVHLVITSPPYDVGIEYDAYLDNNPDYLTMLTDVWRACNGVMVDGARIAVVVPFGIDRNPYKLFVSEVAKTLTEAGFSLGAHITWDKGTTGNITAWGSFRNASKPSVRDRDECIIVAHKGDGALAIPDEHLHKDSVGTYTIWLKDGDYFMELVQSVWLVPPESAQRIKHPAPFPPKLVERLTHLYGYPTCHVLDPFAGSGTVGVVAKELGCQASLFEISPDYCALAQERIHAT
jgi:site-specific DNA-methyltransferase (adenine-specific)